MRTLLTIFFMTLAAQVSSAVGKTFECSLTSDVSWYLSQSKYNEKGFKDNSQEWLGEKIFVNWDDKILSWTEGQGAPTIYYFENEFNFQDTLVTIIFTDELNPEYPQLINNWFCMTPFVRKIIVK